jgi:predicted nucleic acid-binding Zn ribbon protein
MGTWSKGEMTNCDWCGKTYNKARRLGSDYCSSRCEKQAGKTGSKSGIKLWYIVVFVLLAVLFYFFGDEILALL